MQRITFKDLPDTTTPVNAENLNLLQNNVETAISDAVDDVTEVIDSIIESGSNANGNWIKYSDGTMICWHTVLGNTFDCTQSGGTGRYYYVDTNNSSENSKQWTYPQAFINVPTVSAQVGSNAYTMPSIGGIALTWASAYCVTPYAVSNITFTWSFIAIGKWK